MSNFLISHPEAAWWTHSIAANHCSKTNWAFKNRSDESRAGRCFAVEFRGWD